MNEFLANLDYFIDEYYTEKQLYKKGKEYLKRGWLEKKDFLTICLWKSRRPKRYYDLNSEEEIKEITRTAFKELDEAKKIKCLTKLKGVSIPTASTILSITNPELYPIIDERCIQALNQLNFINWERITYKNWLLYLNIIRTMAKENKKSAREIEKGLFAYNRIKLDKLYTNLYK